MGQRENDRWGSYAEWTARTIYSLTKDRGTYHDARDADGNPVEVKSCRLRIQRGDRGKFFIRESNHDKLSGENGFYAFVLYSPTAHSHGPILATALKSAEWVDGLGYTWTGNGHRRGEIVKRPPWDAVFPPEDLAVVGEGGGSAADAVGI